MSVLNGISRTRVAVLLALAAGAGGFGLARLTAPAPTAPRQSPAPARKILYWYDPMVPMERYPGPGKSSMNMDLIPKYADEAKSAEGAGEAGVRIDPARLQNLGGRIVAVTWGTLPSGVSATGVVDFNQRDVAIIQARADGFVQKVYGRAPGDFVEAGAPLADVLIPDWGGAQVEYLAVRRTGDDRLIQAGRQRLILLGMPEGLVARVERTGRPQTTVTISTPTAGVIRSLNARAGMTLAAGTTLAEINGLGSVWVNAAVPESLAGQIHPGSPAIVTFAAFPGETFTGRVSAILPEAQAESRTLTARIELPNRRARFKPGMFASVQIGATARPALLIPSEAIIRTGRRALVMLALDGGRYQPAEVRIGREAGGMSEILAGLAEGEKVVASGQFLIDSEASLSGIQPRPINEGDLMPGQRP